MRQGEAARPGGERRGGRGGGQPVGLGSKLGAASQWRLGANWRASAPHSSAGPRSLAAPTSQPGSHRLAQSLAHLALRGELPPIRPLVLYSDSP